MSAWEISNLDILQVLRLHGLAKHSHEEVVDRALEIVLEQADRVEDATFDFYMSHDKKAAALDEIETILIEEEIITDNRKRFFSPESDDSQHEERFGHHEDDY